MLTIASPMKEGWLVIYKAQELRSLQLAFPCLAKIARWAM